MIRFIYKKIRDSEPNSRRTTVTGTRCTVQHEHETRRKRKASTQTPHHPTLTKSEMFFQGCRRTVIDSLETKMMYKPLTTIFLAFASPSRTARFSHRLATSTEYTITCPPTEYETLRKEVQNHCASLELYLTKQPIATHSFAAFTELSRRLPRDSPIILDSGCGTGRSSLLLGEQNPNSNVVGVDRSIARLSRHLSEESLVEKVSRNVWLVRAELVDFWRCCRQEEWSFNRHYLLYPNPYPKRARIKSRWYAHPSFPILLQLPASEMILRSNWFQYLQEFRDAVNIAAEYSDEFSIFHASDVRQIDSCGQQALTNFEQKYWNVGEPTYELIMTAKKRVE